MPKTYNFSKANEHFNPSAMLMKSRRFHIFPVRFSDGFGVRSTGGIAKKRRDDNDDDDHVKMRGWEKSETRTIIFDRNTNHDYASE